MKRTKRFEIKPLGISIIQLRWDCLNRLFWSLKFNTFSIIFWPPMNYRRKCTVPLKNGEALLRTFCRTFSKTYSEVQFTVIFSTFEKVLYFQQIFMVFFSQKLYNFQIFYRLRILTDILLQVGNTPHLGLFVATVTRIVNDQQKSRIQGSQSGNGLILIRIISLHILVFLYLESFRASWPRYHVV